MPQGDPARVAGRLDTYRSRSAKWHRQVKVDRCPGCGHPHLHRAPIPLVRSVLKNAPCGTVYVVILRVTAVAA
ncbi:hypothetical protein OG337_14775 [[Kitasatospora] papulosa]|uniref:hypothetical protein n=1 Tax=Streptomyces TaxID=1883 RepID=UPI0004C926A8|nr:hypothetical protein [Streptomyces flavovirens]WSZ48527.1 hypothetical protein OG337_14775 [[Kitasatospora] papulosa]